jgi:hypothetical protein
VVAVPGVAVSSVNVVPAVVPSTTPSREIWYPAIPEPALSSADAVHRRSTREGIAEAVIGDATAPGATASIAPTIALEIVAPDCGLM